MAGPVCPATAFVTASLVPVAGLPQYWTQFSTGGGEMANVRKSFAVLVLASLVPLAAAVAAPLPLYVNVIPFTPPNLTLSTAREATAFYVPIAAGATYNFDLAPIGTPMTFGAGPIPATIGLYRVPAGCSGNKTVTLRVLFNMNGSFVSIDEQTRTFGVPNGGAIVRLFDFNAIVAASNFSLNPGDFVRLQIATNDAICLVNEFPSGGTDADATRIVLDLLQLPVLSVTKTLSVVSDPVTGSSAPFAIPGARIRYRLETSNAPGATGDGEAVVFTDTIPAGTSYVAGSLTLDSGGGPVALSDAADADAGEFTGTGIMVDAGTLAPGQTAVVTFDVTVN